MRECVCVCVRERVCVCVRERDNGMDCGHDILAGLCVGWCVCER